MMANYFILVVVFGVTVVDNIDFVQCVYSCKTHTDCSPYYGGSWPYCCGGYITSVDKGRRRCTSRSCLNHYCSRDSDCGDATMCCRSNECVNQGCSGCNSDASCVPRHVCCKKTSRFNETVCATNCLGLTCNFNDDCSGSGDKRRLYKL